MNPVGKLNFFVFNIEGYGEFFSGITPIEATFLLQQGTRTVLYD